jgi:hypothetical protein
LTWSYLKFSHLESLPNLRSFQPLFLSIPLQSPLLFVSCDFNDIKPKLSYCPTDSWCSVQSIFCHSKWVNSTLCLQFYWVFSLSSLCTSVQLIVFFYCIF